MIEQEANRHTRSKITHEARARMQARSAQEQLREAMQESRTSEPDVPDADDSSASLQ